MDLLDLKNKIEIKLKRRIVTSKVLLSNCRLIDESSRLTSAFCDPSYLPFYYYLGTLIKPQKVIEVGFRLGLFGSCLLQGCKTVEYYFGFQETSDEFYSPRLGIGNVKDHYKGEIEVYVGSITDEQFFEKKHWWELAIINEEKNYDKHIAYLDVIWKQMAMDGFIIMDYINRHPASMKAYHDFCKLKNREPITFDTRYGVGIIQR